MYSKQFMQLVNIKENMLINTSVSVRDCVTTKLLHHSSFVSYTHLSLRSGIKLYFKV